MEFIVNTHINPIQKYLPSIFQIYWETNNGFVIVKYLFLFEIGITRPSSTHFPHMLVMIILSPLISISMNDINFYKYRFKMNIYKNKLKLSHLTRKTTISD